MGSNQELLQEIVRTMNARVRALEGKYLVDVDPHMKQYTVKDAPAEGVGGAAHAEGDLPTIFLPYIDFEFKAKQQRTNRDGYLKEVFLVGYDQVDIKQFFAELSKSKHFLDILQTEFSASKKTKAEIDLNTLKLFFKPQIKEDDYIHIAANLRTLKSNQDLEEIIMGTDPSKCVFYRRIQWN